MKYHERTNVIDKKTSLLMARARHFNSELFPLWYDIMENIVTSVQEIILLIEYHRAIYGACILHMNSAGSICDLHLCLFLTLYNS